MEMPKVNEHHEKLKKHFVGSWVGEETLNPSPWDPKGGKAVGRIESKIGVDGFWVINDYTQERDGKITYRGHGVYGWDGKTNTYTMYWFDSMGMDPGGAARGRFEGNTQMFEMSHDMGHSRYIYTFTKEGTYEFRIEQSRDKKTWTTFMDSKWTRR